MADHTFDYVLLGTGQATGTLVADLVDRGGSIAVIEGGQIGGTCVNYGCTPTKTLVASAKAAHDARTAIDYGVQTGPVDVDFERVMDRMNDLRHGSRDGLRRWLESEETVTLFHGWGRFIGDHEIAIRPVSADEPRADGLDTNGTGAESPTTIVGKTIFINVGARARVPDMPGLDTVDWLDNRRILELSEVPRHLIIVGGSYIGLEFGQVFHRLGAEVTVLERSSRIIGREDPDVSEALLQILKDEGLEFVLDAQVERVQSGADGQVTVELTVNPTNAGTNSDTAEETRMVRGSHLLIGAGRTPNTDRLGLDAAHIDTNDRGQIIVNDVLETSAEGVYALGDVNSTMGAFTHTSVNDAEIALSHLFDGDVPGGRRTVSDRILTYALFTDPPLGRVGLTEQQALDRGIDLLKATRPMERISRAKEMGKTDGFVKLLVDAETDQIVGAALLGANGDEIINMFTAVMHSGVPCTEYRSVVFAHPTISELMPWILDDLRPVAAPNEPAPNEPAQ